MSGTDWTSPVPGHWRRDFRLAEWLPAPVSPSAATWLLPGLAQGFSDASVDDFTAGLRLPMHVIVNGWYFTHDPKPTHLVRALVRHPGRMVRFGVAMASMQTHPERGDRWISRPALERYDAVLRPAHLAALADAERHLASARGAELVGIIDDLIRSTGALMLTMVQALGFAGKAEFALATFHQKHLRPRGLPAHLDLLVGLVRPTPPPAHAVMSLDWIEPTSGERPAAGPARAHDLAHDDLIERRIAAEQACRTALDGSPSTQRRFDKILGFAQRSIPVRERLASEFTEAWPVMRAALRSLGEELGSRGVVADADDVYFLTRSEVDAALAGADQSLDDLVATRRRDRDQQARLSPPLSIGKPTGAWRRIDSVLSAFGATATPDGDEIRGIGTSPGIATGPVCVVHGLDDFDSFTAGSVLVAPMTAPAWTPLFVDAVAVVTDGGSPFSHASVIAREYGIPAVIATTDATTRLRSGQTVRVDGAAGSVTILSEHL